jgi:hypothetical protein
MIQVKNRQNTRELRLGRSVSSRPASEFKNFENYFDSSGDLVDKE